MELHHQVLWKGAFCHQHRRRQRTNLDYILFMVAKFPLLNCTFNAIQFYLISSHSLFQSPLASLEIYQASAFLWLK